MAEVAHPVSVECYARYGIVLYAACAGLGLKGCGFAVDDDREHFLFFGKQM